MPNLGIECYRFVNRRRFELSFVLQLGLLRIVIQLLADLDRLALLPV